MGLILHEQAKRERVNAIAWYEDDYPGRGRRFFEALEAVIARVREAPHTFPRTSTRSQMRYAMVPNFPYRVIFCEEGTNVVVYAVAHTKQRPGYWRKRIDSP